MTQGQLIKFQVIWIMGQMQYLKKKNKKDRVPSSLQKVQSRQMSNSQVYNSFGGTLTDDRVY